MVDPHAWTMPRLQTCLELLAKAEKLSAELPEAAADLVARVREESVQGERTHRLLALQRKYCLGVQADLPLAQLTALPIKVFQAWERPLLRVMAQSGGDVWRQLRARADALSGRVTVNRCQAALAENEPVAMLALLRAELAINPADPTIAGFLEQILGATDSLAE